MPITETVRAILTAAAEHPNQLAVLPERLPVAAKQVVIQSMVKAGLVQELPLQRVVAMWLRTALEVRCASRRPCDELQSGFLDVNVSRVLTADARFGSSAGFEVERSGT